MRPLTGRNQTIAPIAPVPSHPGRLTRREIEVAALIAHGLTSRQIAEVLVISVRTADTHADNIRDKLGLHSRLQIAVWAAARLGSPASDN